MKARDSPARLSAVSWFAARGKVAGMIERSYPPGEVSRTHDRRPPGVKFPVFTSVVIAARGYLVGMLR